MKQGRKGKRKDVEKFSVERKKQIGLLSAVNGKWREKRLETIFKNIDPATCVGAGLALGRLDRFHAIGPHDSPGGPRAHDGFAH
jgi:hypothetical protein